MLKITSARYVFKESRGRTPKKSAEKPSEGCPERKALPVPGALTWEDPGP